MDDKTMGQHRADAEEFVSTLEAMDKARKDALAAMTRGRRELTERKIKRMQRKGPPPRRRPVAYQHNGPVVGRNDPCPCGSGKKFKKCCMLL